MEDTFYLELKEIITDWFVDNFDLFDEDIDEYYRDEAKYDLIKKIKKVFNN
jgi:hypothetical protein